MRHYIIPGGCEEWAGIYRHKLTDFWYLHSIHILLERFSLTIWSKKFVSVSRLSVFYLSWHWLFKSFLNSLNAAGLVFSVSL